MSPPLCQVPAKRGHGIQLTGFSANDITHCIRPEDVKERRAVIILRHVRASAKATMRLTEADMKIVTERRDYNGSSSPGRSNQSNYFRRRKRSRESSGEERERERGDSWDRFRKRSKSPQPRRRSVSRGRSRSRSRGRRRSRSRGLRDSSPRVGHTKDRFGRTISKREEARQLQLRRRSGQDPTLVGTSTLCYSVSRRKKGGVANISSRTVDKILAKRNIFKENSDHSSRSRSGSREKIKNEIKKTAPVNKSIASGILKNIMGNYDDDGGAKSSGEEAVDEVVSKITGKSNLDEEESNFKSRLEQLQKQVTDKAKAGAYGKIKFEDLIKLQSGDNHDDENNKQNLEEEVVSLRKELADMKARMQVEKLTKKKKKKEETPPPPSPEDNSDDESESGEDDDDEEDESDEDESSDNESDSDEDSSEEDNSEPKLSVFDVFKTTVLQKQKSTKSTYFYNKQNQRQSKIVETKTHKILKERFEMMKSNKK